MKTIVVKPVQEIEIQLTDKSYKCSFNMLCMANMQESIQTLGNQNIAEISPAHMCALVLYSGIKANDETFTMDEAKALAMNIGPGAYGDIIGSFNESVIDSLDEKDAKQLKKLMAQMMFHSQK